MSFRGQNANSNTTQVWNGSKWIPLNTLSLQDSGANTVLTNSAGNLAINATAGLFSSTSQAITLTTSAGPITLNAAGSISETAGSGFTQIATTGNMTRTATAGAITDTAQAVTIQTTAGPMTLTSNGSMGVTSQTNMSLTSNAGNITRTATSGIITDTAQAITIQTTVGSLALTAGGTGSVNVTSGSNVVLSANAGNGDFLVTAANTVLSGNLIVNGTTTSVNTNTVLIKDAYINIGQGNTAAGARPAGLVVDYLPIAPLAQPVTGAFTGTTISVAGLGAAVGDYVMVTGSSVQQNNGLFQVLTYVDPVLTIATGTADPWVQNTLTAGVASGTVTKMTISVNRVGTSGVWEYASGATSPLTFSPFAVGSPTWAAVLASGRLSGGVGNDPTLQGSDKLTSTLGDTLKIQTQNNGAGATDAISVHVGNASTTGGDLLLDAGDGATGGNVVVSGGDATIGNAAGRSYLKGGSVASGGSGAQLLVDGATALNGGPVSILAGAALTTGDGGDITILAGNVPGTGTGGSVSIGTGINTPDTGDGGDFQISTGKGINGGDLIVTLGGATTGTGGGFSVTGGSASNPAGQGGAVTLDAGGGTSGGGAFLHLLQGNGAGGGSLTLQSGGGAVAGNVNIIGAGGGSGGEIQFSSNGGAPKVHALINGTDVLVLNSNTSASLGVGKVLSWNGTENVYITPASPTTPTWAQVLASGNLSGGVGTNPTLQGTDFLTSAIGSTLTIKTQDTTATDAVSIQTGNASAGASGGITLAVGTATAAGGAITVSAGNAGGAAAGGAVTITSGNTATGTAGDITLNAQKATGAGTNGKINLKSGTVNLAIFASTTDFDAASALSLLRKNAGGTALEYVAATNFGKAEVVVDIAANTAPTAATVQANNITYACSVNAGAITLTLPSGCAAGTKVRAKDRYTGGTQAGTNNITIAGSGGETVDGAATQFVATDLGSLTFIKGNGTDWLIV